MFAADLADPPSAPDSPDARASGAWIEEASALAADIRYQFVPMLDVKHGVINTYHCEPWRQLASGDIRTGYDVLPSQENDALTGELDCGRLKATLTALRSMLARGEVAMIATSVHCRSIETTGPRRALLELLETITPDEKRLIAVVVCGLPDGAPTARIGYVVSFLQRFCRVVSVMRSLKAPHADRLEGTGAFGMNVMVGSAATPPQAVIAALGEFIKGAKRNHLKALAGGLSSPMLVAYAMLSGFNHVSGNGLPPPQAEPEGIRRFDCEAFMAQLGAQKALETAA